MQLSSITLHVPANHALDKLLPLQVHPHYSFETAVYIMTSLSDRAARNRSLDRDKYNRPVTALFKRLRLETPSDCKH
jgi:hypothetical protein